MLKREKLISLFFCALALSWGNARGQGTPWITFRNDRTGATLTLLGTTHQSTFVPLAWEKPVISMIDEADALYFEGVDSLFSARRERIFSAASTRFVREPELTLYPRICAAALKLTFPKRMHSQIDSAPVVLRAFLLEKGIGVKKSPDALTSGFDISDAALVAIALKRGKRVFEAETTEDFVEFASQFNIAQVDEIFSSMCPPTQLPESKPLAQRVADETHRLTINGDWEAYWAMTQKFEMDVMRMPAYAFDAFLAQRSKRMVDRVLNGQTRKNILVVVGGAHMGGPSGMIALLKENRPLRYFAHLRCFLIRQ
jgi:uncharacterized protein YbaP (TraB family)